MNVTLQALVRDQRFDCQIQLVREHWTSVRRLWLDSAVPSDAARIRSDLPDDFLLGCGMPGLAVIRPTRDGRFEFTKDGLTTMIIPCYDTIPGNLDANPEAHVEHLIDMVAVDLDHPDRFWRRRGEALVPGAVFLDVTGQYGAALPRSWVAPVASGVPSAVVGGRSAPVSGSRKVSLM